MGRNYSASWRGTWFFVIGLFVLGETMSALAVDATAWKRWEEKLVSTKAYENPYKDCTISVTYTAPDGKRIDGYGFWAERVAAGV